VAQHLAIIIIIIIIKIIIKILIIVREEGLRICGNNVKHFIAFCSNSL